MHEFLAFTIVGLVIGAAYAVAASGLVVTYSTSGIFNIAHGAVGMFMAFVFWQFWIDWHWPALVALAVSVLVVAPAIGATLELVFIRRLTNAQTATTLVMTIAFMVFLIGLVQTIWKGSARNLPYFFGNHGFHLAGVFVTWEQLITVLTAIGVAIVLRVVLYRTRTGIAMRAVVDNRTLVGLNGGRPAWLGTLSWAIGSSMASLAGILIAPQLQLSVLPLTLLVVAAYAAAMFGRLRSLPLTFVGALALGLIQSYGVGYLPIGGFWDSTPIQGLRDSIPAVLLFVVLLVLPQDRIRGSSSLLRRLNFQPPSFMRSLQGGVLLVGGVALVALQLGPGDLVYLASGLALGLIMLSLVPLTGWGGQISLCQMTFAGLGAFAMYRVGTHGNPLGLLAAAGLAGAVGAVIALPALRLRGLYLALATLAFAECMDNMFFPTTVAFTYNGSVPVPRPAIFGLHYSSDSVGFAIFLSVIVALVAIGLSSLRRGPFGRVLLGMKDSEAACSTLGLSLTTTKLAVFALSAAIAGFGGALYGASQSVAGSTDFYSFQSLPIILLAVVWGVSTTSGPILAGLVLGLGPAFQQNLPQVPQLTFLASGLIAMVVLCRWPDGIMPAIFNSTDRLLTAGGMSAPPPADADRTRELARSGGSRAPAPAALATPTSLPGSLA
jgi:branched-chain amino acid transport system permease protein